MAFRILAKNPAATPVAIDTASTNITSAAWVEVEDSMTESCTAIQFYNAGNKTLIVGTGAAASEVDTGLRIYPGAVSQLIPIEISKSTRVALKAVGADQTSGLLVINFFG